MLLQAAGGNLMLWIVLGAIAACVLFLAAIYFLAMTTPT
jgi:hypothetical protein